MRPGPGRRFWQSRPRSGAPSNWAAAWRGRLVKVSLYPYIFKTSVLLAASSISIVLGTPVLGDNGGGYNAPKVLRLAFHDCLKYEDGSGGCDGCLNWDGVGVLYDKFKQRLYPDRVATDNNGLTNAVEVLEAIYTDPVFPGLSPVLEQSLQESGKSRADLWSLAGITAVEYTMETNNLKVAFHLTLRIVVTIIYLFYLYVN